MLISNFPSSGSLGKKSFFDAIRYTGSISFIDDGEDNWRVKFLTSGTLTIDEDVSVDIFAVGGGGNGATLQYTTTNYGGGGGGGGYTKTEKNKLLEKGKNYSITVGAACSTSSLVDESGEVLCEAAGGKTGVNPNAGDGGSGGGAGSYQNYANGSPGSDGANGTNSYQYYTGGKGQGTTTREFGELTGDLYAGGGGGGACSSRSNSNVPGAEGGGGNGGTKGTYATNGAENTGGGGGGGGCYSGYTAGGAGGSGIVIIRNVRES